jgi:hypothetical protein
MSSGMFFSVAGARHFAGNMIISVLVTTHPLVHHHIQKDSNLQQLH